MDKLAIVGYGKMGKIIEKYAKDFNFQVCAIIDPIFNNTITQSELNGATIAVEFTTPEASIENYKKLLDSKVNVVTGTTGWHDSIDKVRAIVEKSKQGFFYASNFSIGMNIMFELNKHLAKIISNVEGYSLSISETHHAKKLDKPSGTAVSLAMDIIENQSKYNAWKLSNENLSKTDIPITSIREGEIVGLHNVEYKSLVDRISIEHEAFARDGFAIGALTACRYMIGKQGIHTMKNLLKL